jgi:hypothetical protein
MSTWRPIRAADKSEYSPGSAMGRQYSQNHIPMSHIPVSHIPLSVQITLFEPSLNSAARLAPG